MRTGGVFKFVALAALTLVLVWGNVYAKRRTHKEVWYQQQWCKSRDGTLEYQLRDGTRVDCIVGDYAIEFDFADKWAEAIGQASYYAVQLRMTPGIVLIFEDDASCRFFFRANIAINQIIVVSTPEIRPIRVWKIGNAYCAVDPLERTKDGN